jgi:hypothetical protein
MSGVARCVGGTTVGHPPPQHSCARAPRPLCPPPPRRGRRLARPRAVGGLSQRPAAGGGAASRASRRRPQRPHPPPPAAPQGAPAARSSPDPRPPIQDPAPRSPPAAAVRSPLRAPWRRREGGGGGGGAGAWRVGARGLGVVGRQGKWGGRGGVRGSRGRGARAPRAAVAVRPARCRAAGPLAPPRRHPPAARRSGETGAPQATAFVGGRGARAPRIPHQKAGPPAPTTCDARPAGGGPRARVRKAQVGARSQLRGEGRGRAAGLGTLGAWGGEGCVQRRPASGGGAFCLDGKYLWRCLSRAAPRFAARGSPPSAKLGLLPVRRR